MISGFHCSVNEVFALLGCYAVLIGGWWHFRTAWWPHLQGVGPTGRLETLLANHRSTLCNIPEEQRPQRYSCPCACHKGIWGSGGVALLILNLHRSWRCVISFMLQLLYPWWEGLQYPLNWKVDGFKLNSSYRHGENCIVREVPCLE
jgi:hypothetical protein